MGSKVPSKPIDMNLNFPEAQQSVRKRTHKVNVICPCHDGFIQGESELGSKKTFRRLLG